MAGKNVLELTPVESLTGTELMYVSQGGVDKSATPDDIIALVVPTPSSGTLGLVQLSDGAGGFDSDANLAWDSGTQKATIGNIAIGYDGSGTPGTNNGSLLAGDDGIGLSTSPDIGSITVQTTGVQIRSADYGTVIVDASGFSANPSGKGSLLIDGDISLNLDGGSQIILQASDNSFIINSGSAGWTFDGETGVVFPTFIPLDLGKSDKPVGSVYASTSLSTPDVVMSSGAASVIILPTADPEVVGALWNNAGTITISAGP